MRVKGPGLLRRLFALCLSLCLVVSTSRAWFIKDEELSLPTVGGSVLFQADAYDVLANKSKTDADYGLSPTNPFVISKPRHLYNLAWLQYMGTYNEETGTTPTYYFTLADVLYDDDGSLADDADVLDMSGYVLPPIGTVKYPFLSSFNGNGKTIANLTVGNVLGDAAQYRIPANRRPPLLRRAEAEGVYNVEVAGFFGVVGQLEDDTHFTYTEANNEVKNVTLKDMTVSVQTSTALVGLAAGYVNGQLSGVGVEGGKVHVGNSVTAYDSADLTGNLSDYALVGYATDPFLVKDVVTVGPRVKVTEPVNLMDALAANGMTGTDAEWGGSLAMKDMYNRLVGYYDRATRVPYYAGQNTNLGYFRELDLDSSNLGKMTFSQYDNAGTTKTYMYLYGEEPLYRHEGYVLYFNGTYYRPTNAFQYNSASQALWFFSDMELRSGELYYYNTNKQPVYMVISGSNNQLNVTTGSSQATISVNTNSGYVSNGDDRYSTPSNRTRYHYYTETQTSVNGSFSSVTWDIYNGYLRATLHGTATIETSTRDVTQKESQGWLGGWNSAGDPSYSNYSSTSQTVAQIYRYVKYASNKYTAVDSTDNATSMTATLTACYFSEPTGFPGETDESLYPTYLPLKLNKAEDDVDANNTGYLMSGYDYPATKSTSSGKRYKYGDVRVSQYALKNLYKSFNTSSETAITYNDANRAKLQVLTKTYKTGENYVRISDEDNGGTAGTHSELAGFSQKTAKDAGLVKYVASKRGLNGMLSGDTNAYGLHFMNATIDKDKTVTIPTAYVPFGPEDGEGNVQPISNLKMPADCIDFYLKSKGVINFFAGSYFPGNTAFFSLHQIFRDAGYNITAIKEIKEVWGNPANGFLPYAYKYTDNTWSGEKPAGSQLLFDTAWITDSATVAMIEYAAYYFEIPVNEGEYALGSVPGQDGAYLMYLDIGANGAEGITENAALFEVIDTTTVRESLPYPMGVDFAPGEKNTFAGQTRVDGGSDPIPGSASGAATLNGSGDVTYTREGNTITGSGSLTQDVTYAAEGVTLNGTGRRQTTTLNFYKSATVYLEDEYRSSFRFTYNFTGQDETDDDCYPTIEYANVRLYTIDLPVRPTIDTDYADNNFVGAIYWRPNTSATRELLYYNTVEPVDVDDPQWAGSGSGGDYVPFSIELVKPTDVLLTLTYSPAYPTKPYTPVPVFDYTNKNAIVLQHPAGMTLTRLDNSTYAEHPTNFVTDSDGINVTGVLAGGENQDTFTTYKITLEDTGETMVAPSRLNVSASPARKLTAKKSVKSMAAIQVADNDLLPEGGGENLEPVDEVGYFFRDEELGLMIPWELPPEEFPEGVEADNYNGVLLYAGIPLTFGVRYDRESGFFHILSGTGIAEVWYDVDTGGLFYHGKFLPDNFWIDEETVTLMLDDHPFFQTSEPLVPVEDCIYADPDRNLYLPWHLALADFPHGLWCNSDTGELIYNDRVLMDGVQYDSDEGRFFLAEPTEIEGLWYGYEIDRYILDGVMLPKTAQMTENGELLVDGKPYPSEPLEPSPEPVPEIQYLYFDEERELAIPVGIAPEDLPEGVSYDAETHCLTWGDEILAEHVTLDQETGCLVLEEPEETPPPAESVDPTPSPVKNETESPSPAPADSPSPAPAESVLPFETSSPEPASSASPEVTETEHPIESPTATESAQTGEDPENTESAQAGEDPENTESAQAGGDPESTESAQAGGDPESTESAQVSEDPENSQDPEASEGPNLRDDSQEDPEAQNGEPPAAPSAEPQEEDDGEDKEEKSAEPDLPELETAEEPRGKEDELPEVNETEPEPVTGDGE